MGQVFIRKKLLLTITHKLNLLPGWSSHKKLCQIWITYYQYMII